MMLPCSSSVQCGEPRPADVVSATKARMEVRLPVLPWSWGVWSISEMTSTLRATIQIMAITEYTRVWCQQRNGDNSNVQQLENTLYYKRV